MTTSSIWVVNCQENCYPGMWQRWLKNQCVAVGWPPGSGFKFKVSHSDRSWNAARRALARMKVGDLVAVALRDLRVGRLGEITGKVVKDDEWGPLVPVGPSIDYGEMGRRVLVRWDLATGPENFDWVVQLPRELNVFGRPAVSQKSVELGSLIEEMNNPVNWVSLRGKFQ